MEFADVIRRRHMVRTYTDEPVPRSTVDAVVNAGLRAPSAGFSQGFAFVVLEGAAQTEMFWQATLRGGLTPKSGGRFDRLRAAPVVIIPLSHKAAYLDRYNEPDKAGLGLEREDGWPSPYWDIDTAFATMTMLLAATDAGLGALFFGIFEDHGPLRAAFAIPGAYQPIGAITLGWPARRDPKSPSLSRGRRPRDHVVHYGSWGGGPALEPSPSGADHAGTGGRASVVDSSRKNAAR